MARPRAIDQELVDAYLARRALDYLVGFNLSPVLWRKLPGARSAGRVQSVALRLVCDRETEIERFVARGILVDRRHLKTPAGASFEARLVGADGEKITRLDVGTAKEAEAFKAALDAASFNVANIEAKPGKRHPFAPFTTSTLQQEASRKLGFVGRPHHARGAAALRGLESRRESGFITYMRTDGIDIAPEAIADIRRAIGGEFGKRYLPAAPRHYPTRPRTPRKPMRRSGRPIRCARPRT